MTRVVSNFLDTLEEKAGYGAWDVSDAERRYVAKALQKVEIIRGSSLPAHLPLVSDKFTKLKEALLQQPIGFASIIFVKERAMAVALAHLLSVHPETRGHFRVGTMVGTSASTQRTKNIGELCDLSSQKHTLSLFKAGVVNIIM